MSYATRVVLLVLLVVCVVLVALLTCAIRKCRDRGDRGDRGDEISGGAPRRKPPGQKSADHKKSPHAVVDLLNLSNYMLTTAESRKNRTPITTADIIHVVGATAPTLRARHGGRVMYVVKDRDSAFNTLETRERYRRAAEEHSVYIYVVERYVDPPAGEKRRGAEHSDKGRDDFYMALLAKKWRCAVITEDRFRDFAHFRSRVDPFHVLEYAYWRKTPERDFVRPTAAAYAALAPPVAARYAEYFDGVLTRPPPATS
jgi:hypothetical protein